MENRLMRNLWKIIALVVCVALILIGGLLFLRARQTAVSSPPVSSSVPDDGRVLYNGDWYLPKKDLTTVLVMGLDKYQAPEEEIGYLNDQQCDFLMLLVLDHETQTCDILHINRDTMTKIQRLGVGGGEAGSFTGQLALAHTFGSGGSDSCLNTTKAVSDFLGGVSIDHYLSMTMEAVAILNDLVGGVPVTLVDDFTAIDPTMVQGANVRLMGDQALTYVRARGSLTDSSNTHRMERQRDYLASFYNELIAHIKTDKNFLHSAIWSVIEYIKSDCTSSQLETLGEALEDCTVNPISTIDGEALVGEEFMEFHADEASVEQTVISLFYTPLSESAS